MEYSMDAQHRVHELGFASLPPSVLADLRVLLDRLRAECSADADPQHGETSRGVADVAVVVAGEGHNYITIAGEGASIPKDLYVQLGLLFQTFEPHTRVSFTPTSSGAGKRALIDGRVAWAATEAEVTVEERERADGNIVMLPIAGAAVVPVYRLPFAITI